MAALLAVPFNENNLIPERYYRPSPDWDAVTESNKYQDGGASFNANNTVAPQEFEYIFNGLTETEAAVFDAHYDAARGQLFDFPYTDRGTGQYFPSGTRYKSFERSHDANRRWIQTRKIVLVRYP